MHSTYPTITKYTPAVLRAHCEQIGVTADALRLGTLKRAECEIGNLLENALTNLHPDEKGALENLHRAVRLAIGDE